MSRCVDITGQRFGRLVALNREPSNAAGNAMWRMVCDCGKVIVARGIALRVGNTRSCGCLQRDRTAEAARKMARHGAARHGAWTPEYQSWRGMMQRVTNLHAAYSHNYAGRGITVCDRWRVFEKFLTDLGPRPAGKSLDRIDVNGNYEPGNVRWATPMEQAHNKRPRAAKTGG